ncbi:alpha/beta hydrolase [Skermania piniformis]|uniref:Alpha/beta hydrolase n=2 Tax=Skermania pinensis TaxID=39122 RepID=A0ABX8SDN5_9ACTN|nr:alpha/beta hydrolase [Skermania piniformis]QXQ16023.1 alpha/beta hydrolase [Skermania piniformis]
MHLREQGSGPPVIFLHGFPHTGFVWHRQLAAVAAAGWHAIAPDLRGFGGTDAPTGPAAYTNVDSIADLTGLLDQLGADRAVFVGLDFGAVLTWELALRVPDRVRAVIVCNNPYLGRAPRRPSEIWARMARRHFVHLHHFQQPGSADAELAGAPREFLARVYYALSGDYHYLDVWQHPPGTRYLDALPVAPPLPWPWLSEAEFELLASTFERTGFTGGLNWYRALDRNWELGAALPDAPVAVPAFFLYGERDCDMEGFSGMDPIGTMRARVPDLRAADMVADAGHLLPLERTGATDALLLRYLAEL